MTQDQIVGVISLVITIALLPIFYTYESYACGSRAEAQGFTSTYGIMQGCVYTLPDGKKVNEKNYRVL